MWEYRAQVTKVVDADTLDLHIDLGFYLYTRQRFRLARIDAWETRGEEREQGLIAKTVVQSLLPPGRQVRITTEKTGKYGRWIAEVWCEDEDGDEFNLSDWLITHGHGEAVTY